MEEYKDGIFINCSGFKDVFIALADELQEIGFEWYSVYSPEEDFRLGCRYLKVWRGADDKYRFSGRSTGGAGKEFYVTDSFTQAAKSIIKGIKPKYEVGDWVVCSFSGGKSTYQIVDIDSKVGWLNFRLPSNIQSVEYSASRIIRHAKPEEINPDEGYIDVLTGELYNKENLKINEVSRTIITPNGAGDKTAGTGAPLMEYRVFREWNSNSFPKEVKELGARERRGPSCVQYPGRVESL